MNPRRLVRTLPSTIMALNEVADTGSLVFLPDFGGNVIYAQSLVQQLARDVSCYGIRFAPDMIDHLGEMTISTMAERFAADIVEANMAKPIHVIGFSFAGIFAFETAFCLSKAGAQADRLWILDSQVHRKVPGYKAWQHPLQELLYLTRYAAKNWRRALGGGEDEMILHQYGQLRMDLSQHPEAYRFIIRHMYEALASYRPQRWNGSATLLRARKVARWTRLPADLGWAQVIGDGLDTVSVPGDHLSMLRNPAAAKTIAGVIRDRLARPETEKVHG